MVSISCFYNHYNREPINITFIKYNSYFKVILNNISIIITTEMLISNEKLFQMYIISLLCTEDTSIISYKNNKYGVNTIKYWKYICFNDYYDFIELFFNKKNPLNTIEPKRASSSKKIRKFEKLFNKYMTTEMIKNPIELIIEYFELQTDDIIANIECIKEYEDKIDICALLLHEFGYDIYSVIEKHL